MASVYTNDLRLEEIGSGEQSGTWGDTTNTNLELIAEAFSFGTEAITTNADTHTTTIADGASDPGRSMFLKYTGTLDSACTITIAPNTVSKLWFIENGTSGSQNIIISQGSGANITIPPGDTKAIYSDGAGSSAAMVDAFASLSVVDLKVQDDLTVTDDAAIGGLATVGGTLGVTGIATFTDDIIIGDGKTIGSASTVGAITIASDGDITLSADLNVGANFDVTGNAVIDGTALVTGVLTTTAATVFNGGFAAVQESTVIVADGQADNAYAFQIKNEEATDDRSFGLLIHAGSTATDRGLTINTHDGGKALFYVQGNGQALHTVASQGSAFVPNTSTTWNALEIFQDRGVTNSASGIAFRSQSGTAPAGIVSVAGNTTGGIESLAFMTSTGNATIERMRIKDTGLVGIGTDDPSAGLTVQAADGNVGGTIMITSTGVASAGMACDANGLNFGADTGGFVFKTGGSANDPTDSGTSKMQLTSGGVLEVGEIQEQTQGTDISVTMVSEDAGLALTSRSATDAHSGYISFVKTPATSGNYTATASGDRLGVINFVGVNTSAGADNGAQILVEQTGTASGTVPAKMSFFTNEAEKMQINSVGQVFVGEYTWLDAGTKAGLQVAGAGGGPYVIVCKNDDTSGGANQIKFLDGGNDICGTIASNATNNTTAYGTSSDYRLKENVTDVSNAISTLKTLKPKTYNFISDPDDTPENGFLAHELATVVPNAVIGEKDAVTSDGAIEPQQVDYGKLTPILTAALQEAIAKIETLETKVAALEA